MIKFKKMLSIVLIIALIGVVLPLQDKILAQEQKVIVSAKFLEEQIPSIIYPSKILHFLVEVTYNDGSKEILPNTEFSWNSSDGRIKDIGTYFTYKEGNVTIKATYKSNNLIYAQTELNVLDYPIVNVFKETFINPMIMPANLETGGVTIVLPKITAEQSIQIKNKLTGEIVKELDSFTINSSNKIDIYDLKPNSTSPSKLKDNTNYTFEISLLEGNVVIDSVERSFKTYNNTSPSIDDYSFNQQDNTFQVLSSINNPDNIYYNYQTLYYSFISNPPLEWQFENITTANIGDVIPINIIDIFGNKTIKHIELTENMVYHNDLLKVKVYSPLFVTMDLKPFNPSNILLEVTYKDGSTKIVNGEQAIYSLPYGEEQQYLEETNDGIRFISGTPVNETNFINLKYQENEEIIRKIFPVTYTGLVSTPDLEKPSNPEEPINELVSIYVEDYKGFFEVERNNGFNLNEIQFIAYYQNGNSIPINYSKITPYISDDYRNIISITDNVVKFSDEAEIGETAKIIFSYEEFPYIQSTEVTFEKIRDSNIVLVDLISHKKIYEVGRKESFDLNNFKFKVYFSDTDIEELTSDLLYYEIQYKYLSKINTDLLHREQKLLFKDNANIGDYIFIDYYYTYRNITKLETIKIMLVEDTNSDNKTEELIFNDISNHWAEKDITKLASKDMIVGHENNQFFPNRYVTRGEVAGFISKFLSLKDGTEIPFTDVRKYDWNYQYIANVYREGIFKGYDDNTFKPNVNITREELAAILVRVYKYKYNIEDISINTTDFKDQKYISKWAQKVVKEAKGLRLIYGKGNNIFAPKDNATRAELSAILSRMLERK